MLLHSNIAAWLRDLLNTPITLAVMLLSIVPYLLLMSSGSNSLNPWLITPHASDLLNPTLSWKAISPIFIHYTLMHLGVNLYLWWLFASQLERYSRWLLIGLVFTSAIISNLCQLWVAGNKFGGLSGVVFSLGAFCWIQTRLCPQLQLKCDNTLAAMLLVTLVAAATGLMGNYSNGAHLAGLLFGLGTGLAFAHWVRSKAALRG